MKVALSKLTILVISIALTSNVLAIPQIKPGDVLAVNQIYNGVLGSQPPSLDPSLANDTESAAVDINLFATLVREDTPGKIKPYAAVSWEISPDGKVYTFHLRKNAKWSNGVPVVAGDFVYGWRRLVDPKTAGDPQSYLNQLNVKNAEQIVAGKLPTTDLGIKAIDDYTLQVELTQPTPWFLSALIYTATAPLYKPTIEQHGSQWVRAENLVSNGPFKLASSKVNEELQLVVNPYYWDADKLQISQINYRILNDGQLIYRAFQAGELPKSGVPKAFFEEAQKSGNLYTFSDLATNGFAFDQTLVSDVRIRKAIAYAFDNFTIVNKIVKRNQIPAYSWTPPYVVDAQDIKPGERYSLSQEERNRIAIQLLQDAGYSKENPYKITLTSPTTSNADTKQARIAIQNILNTNTNGLLEVTLDSQEWKVYLQNIRNRELAFYFQGWAATYNQASIFLDRWISTSTTNRQGFKNAEFDHNELGANASQDLLTRKKLYAAADYVLVNKEYAVIPFQHYTTNILISPTLKGVQNTIYSYIEDYYFVEPAGK